jgi:hypothetical protein
LPKDWWKKQETIRVNILGPQGFILNRYMVYEIVTDVSCISPCAVLSSFLDEDAREAHQSIVDIPSSLFYGIV